MYFNICRELLKETQRRLEAEQRVGASFVQTLDDNDNHEIEKDSVSFSAKSSPMLAIKSNLHHMECLEHKSFNNHCDFALASLIQRAKRLLGIHNVQQPQQQKLLTYENTTSELMLEFQNLLEAFYIEQQQSNATKDVIWLFEELEWRFEEIKRGYEAERFNWESSLNSNSGERKNVNMNEWRACLIELIDAVTIQNMDGVHPNSEDAIQEVAGLQQQLSSLSIMHKQKCLNFSQEIEAMKQNHQESSEQMSKIAENLSTKLSEQENTILQLQQDIEAKNNLLLHERQSNRINEESMTARIKYLEEIVRLSDVVKSPISRGICTQKLTTVQSNGYEETDQVTTDNLNVKDVASAPGPKIEANESLIVSLRQQIEELGNLLEESEEQRANAIEEFQLEREEYIRQYGQLSNYVRQILGDEEGTHCNGNNRLD